MAARNDDDDDDWVWGDTESQVAECLSKGSKLEKGGSSRIKVVVRVRPPNTRETSGEDGGGVCVEVEPKISSLKVLSSPAKRYTFDTVFSPETTQLQVFENLGLDLVASASVGYNASLFSYGQTASGKSHTVTGPDNDPGLVPRVVHLLFALQERIQLDFSAKSGGGKLSVLVEVSTFEIYNEKVRDLLNPGNMEVLKIREDKQLGVHVQGLQKIVVEDVASVQSVISSGTHNRSVASTKYNSESSRSHAIFEIHLHLKQTMPSAGKNSVKVTGSKIALIDLAGSERSDKLGSKGKALAEGNSINKTLNVLGRVITALVKKEGMEKSKAKTVLVPYRESLLTSYLRESLGGELPIMFCLCRIQY